jgi:hypothetical protein
MLDMTGWRSRQRDASSSMQPAQRQTLTSRTSVRIHAFCSAAGITSAWCRAAALCST